MATVKANPRYVGLFHYSSYWRMWDKILAIKDGKWWVVVEVDLAGNPIAEQRTHITAMEANRFADKPFAVKPGDL